MAALIFVKGLILQRNKSRRFFSTNGDVCVRLNLEDAIPGLNTSTNPVWFHHISQNSSA